MNPNRFILQTPATYETRAVHAAALLDAADACRHCDIGNLPAHAEALKNGAVPVGSVEFVRAAMGAIGVAEPHTPPYPDPLSPWLGRRVWQGTVSDAIGSEQPVFVKPWHLKRFNGFVHDASKPEADLDEHDAEQRRILLALDPSEAVWLSDPVAFVSEWRVYVNCDGGIIGCGRYDDGPDDAPAPDDGAIADMLFESRRVMPHGHTLDVGVLDNGQTVLVEVNDAWAIGLYGDSVPKTVYAKWLAQRWRTLLDAHPVLSNA